MSNVMRRCPSPRKLSLLRLRSRPCVARGMAESACQELKPRASAASRQWLVSVRGHAERHQVCPECSSKHGYAVALCHWHRRPSLAAGRLALNMQSHHASAVASSLGLRITHRCSRRPSASAELRRYAPLPCMQKVGLASIACAASSRARSGRGGAPSVGAARERCAGSVVRSLQWHRGGESGLPRAFV